MTTGHELTGGGMAISLPELLRGYRLTEAESEDGGHGLDAGEVEEWEDGEVRVGRSALQLVGGRAAGTAGRLLWWVVRGAVVRLGDVE